MWSFILAGLMFAGSIALAFFVAFAQGMASAPRYDNTPWVIIGAGAVFSAIIVASHWLPHLGW